MKSIDRFYSKRFLSWLCVVVFVASLPCCCVCVEILLPCLSTSCLVHFSRNKETQNQACRYDVGQLRGGCCDSSKQQQQQHNKHKTKTKTRTKLIYNSSSSRSHLQLIERSKSNQYVPKKVSFLLIILIPGLKMSSQLF
jgi:hypothetical protein